MKKRFSMWLACLMLSVSVLIPGATHSAEPDEEIKWDAVIEDGDGWLIKLKLFEDFEGALHYTGEMILPRDLRHPQPFFNMAKGVYIKDSDQLAIETAWNCTGNTVLYLLKFTGPTTLHGNYTVCNHDCGPPGTCNEKGKPISAKLIEGRVGRHSVETPSSAAPQKAVPDSSSDMAALTALPHPSACGISMAINQSSFRMSDTLEVYLRVDAALLRDGTADLWVRMISPTGIIRYIGPENTLSDQALPLKQAWQVQDMGPETVLCTSLSDPWESGKYNLQAILTTPGYFPGNTDSWITSDSALALIHGHYDATGRMLIRLGALVPLSGELSSTGIASGQAIRLAVEQINQIFQDAGMPTYVQLFTADSEACPQTAYREFGNLEALGADMVVGPDTSASAKAVGNLAKENDRVYISASSTSTELARPDDNLIRLVPDDSHQAKAIEETIREGDITRLAVISRSDVFGRSLTEEVTDRFEEEGGEVFFVRQYGKGGFDPASLIGELSAATAGVLNDVAPASVGVLLISFSEGIDMLRAASEDPTLEALRWYGTDGMALDPDLVEDEVAAGFAARAGFSCPTAPRRNNSTYQDMEGALMDSLGYIPSPYALGFYDAAWLAVLSVLVAGDDRGNPETVSAILRWITKFYTGATGPFVLNEFDDRENASYDFWHVTHASGKYQWEQGKRWEGTATSGGPPEVTGLSCTETRPDNRTLLRMLEAKHLGGDSNERGW